MPTDMEIKQLGERLLAERATWAKYATEHGASGHLPFRYLVKERCMRTLYEDFGLVNERRYQVLLGPSRTGEPVIYAIDTPQVSTALEPMDPFTRVATTKRAKEIELLLASRAEAAPEVQALRQQVAEQTTAAAKADVRAEEQDKKIAELTAAVQALVDQSQGRGGKR